MKPVIINTELYCHKIEIFTTSYDPDLNCFTENMVDNCPDPIIEYICNQLAEGNRFGKFESVHEWLTEDIETYYSGNWRIVENNGEDDCVLHETIADLAQFTTEIMSSGTFDSRAVTSEIIRWAKEFCKIHPVSVWEELDYFETLDRYATDKIKEFINNHI